MKLVILIITIIFINTFIVFCEDRLNSLNNNTFKPLQIHLSLTNDENNIIVTWLTKLKLSQATVYYYQGECKELKDETYETLLQSIKSDKLTSLRISLGKSEIYSRYDGFVHHVTMENLSQGKEYCYSVGGSQIRNKSTVDSNQEESSTWSHWRSFKTVKSKGEPSIFGAIADSGTYGNVFDVSKSIARDPDISLLIHAGDLSYGKVEEKWDSFGDTFEPVTSKMPFMVIPGNWDVKEGAILPFYNRYKMPLPYSKPTIIVNHDDSGDAIQSHYNLFYSFRYGYTYHIMISSYDPYHNGSLQYQWLEKELVLANQKRNDYPWLIVSAHSPMYSSSSGHNGSDTVFRGQLEHLFRKHQVNLVLSGHDHGYERTYPVYDEYTFTKHPKNYSSSQGTVHVVVGTGGADTDPWLSRPKWTAHRESTSGYTKIIAHRHTLSVTYIRINNSIGDEFIILNTPSYKTSAHAPFIIIFLIFLVVIFPICAYNKIPNRIFSSLMSHRERKDFKSLI